ncbi:hypothetical protein FRC04_005666 [Tulasnella sp. 424]|nr:hypothetical protein FRC04_005666 [Tulasnella sp. 424]
MVEFTWPRIGHRQPDELDDERQGRTWKFNQVTSGRLSNSDAMDLIRELQDAGIMDPLCLDARHRESKKRDRHCIFCGRETLLELFRCLSSVKKLIIRTADAGRFLPTLVEPDLGATDQGQFRCPSLTQLEVQRDTRQFFSWSGDEEVDTFQEDIRVSPKATIYEFIRKRQIMARSPNGPAKLQRIGIPRVYMDETLFEDPALDGIEFYETSHW